MTAFTILTSLPADFAVQRSDRGVLAVRKSCEALLRAAGLEIESGPETTSSDLIGRRPLQEIVTDAGTLVVRSFVHGGLARKLTGERFADPERPFRELVVSEDLRAHGVTTPEIVAARARRAPIGGWYLDLISKKVEGLLSLTRVFALVERGEVSQVRLRELTQAVGRLVRRFHDIGFVHADLTTENLLLEQSTLESGEPRFCTLDLDRSEFDPDLSNERRRDNLRRLLRCLIRRTTHTTQIPVVGLCARFLRGYETERAARRDDWKAIALAAQRSRAPHALGWFLERALGQSRASDEKGISRLPVSAPKEETQSEG